VEKTFEVHAALHPQHPEMGTRTLKLQPQNGVASVFLAGSDKPILESGNVVRLMGLFNLKLLSFSDGELKAQFLGEAVSGAEKAPILQWVPWEQSLSVDVVMPNASIKNGFAESGLSSEPVGSVIQFVRFGFGRVDKITPNRVTVYFAHQ
jgi:glutamyl-tRNA synthetase